MRTFVRGLGQVFITAGLVILFFAAYELYGTGIATGRAQHQLTQAIRHDWSSGPTAIPTAGPALLAPDAGVTQVPRGRPLAVLRIPRFGKGWTPRVIVEGVTLADLRIGPGHYPTTALPGQIGNFAVAGHRATHGNGFFKMDQMRIGDAIVVETRLMWLTYRVSGTELVLPTTVAVIAAVPDKPGAVPAQRMITLTTCDPWYSATHRLIVHGVLLAATPKSAGLPPALRS